MILQLSGIKVGGSTFPRFPLFAPFARRFDHQPVSFSPSARDDVVGRREKERAALNVSRQSGDALYYLSFVFLASPTDYSDATPSAISLFLSHPALTRRESPHHLSFLAVVFLGGKGPCPPRRPVRFSLSLLVDSPAVAAAAQS